MKQVKEYAPLPQVTWRPRNAVTGIEGVRRWTRVEKAVYWSPIAGEVLEGLYGGVSQKTRRDGGTYCAHIVHTQTKTYQVGGVVLDSLIASASVRMNEPIRVVSKGKVKCKNNPYHYNDYDLYVGRQ